MRRSLLHLLRATSLVLLVASLILWHRSYRVANGLAWQHADGSLREIVSYAGGLQIRQLHPLFALTPIAPARLNVAEPVPANANWQTRAGSFTNQVLWQRAGFVLLAGHTQNLTLTGSSAYRGYGISGVSGTINTSYFVSNGSAATTPLAATGTLNIPGNGVITTGGMASGSLVFQADSTQLLLVIPWWFIAALCALLPTASLARLPILIRTHRRRNLNLCTKCGYDLRSSNDRCPECGQHHDHE